MTLLPVPVLAGCENTTLVSGRLRLASVFAFMESVEGAGEGAADAGAATGRFGGTLDAEDLTSPWKEAAFA